MKERSEKPWRPGPASPSQALMCPVRCDTRSTTEVGVLLGHKLLLHVKEALCHEGNHRQRHLLRISGVEGDAQDAHQAHFDTVAVRRRNVYEMPMHPTR